MAEADTLPILDGNFGISQDVNQQLLSGVDFSKKIAFGSPTNKDIRIQAAGVMDAYLRKYQAWLDAQVYGPGINSYFEFGSLSPFSYLDTQYIVHPRELESIDRHVGEVQRAMAIMARLFRTLDVGRGRTLHKQYLNIDPLDPILSKNFKTYEPGAEALAETEVHFQGVHKDYKFGMVELDASRISNYLEEDALVRTTREFTALVADFKERILLRGGDILSGNIKNIDARVEGLVNWTGIQTQTTTTDFTTFGNGTTAIVDSIKSLKDYFFRPPYVILMTPWVYIQFLKGRHTYSNKTELWEILNLGAEAGEKLISQVAVSPHLLNAAESTTTGAMYVIAPKDNAGRDNVYIAESYPLWHYPLTLGTEIGVAGKIAWMGSTVIRRPESIVATTGITTN